MTTASTTTRTRSSLGIGSSSLPIVRSRTKLLAGIAVTIFAAMFASVVYGSVGDRTDVVSLVKDVEQGHAITASDLGVAQVSVSGDIRTIASKDRSQLVGQVATTHLSAGSLLAPSSLSRGAALGPGQVKVAALMKPGQYPVAMKPGDSVRLVLPDAPADASAAPIIGTVASIDNVSDVSGSSTVTFTTDDAVANAVASAGATGDLAAVVRS